MKEEVQTAIAQLKDGKASGPDNIQTKLLKLFDQQTRLLLECSTTFTTLEKFGMAEIWICCYSKENKTKEVWMEHIFKEVLDGMNKGILINGLGLNNIRYTDDTIVFADNLEDLQALVERINLQNITESQLFVN